MESVMAASAKVVDTRSGVEVTPVNEADLDLLNEQRADHKTYTALEAFPVTFDVNGQQIVRSNLVRFCQAVSTEWAIEGYGFVDCVCRRSVSIIVHDGSIKYRDQICDIRGSRYQFPIFKVDKTSKHYGFDPNAPKVNWMQVLDPIIPDVPPFDPESVAK